MNQTTLPSPLRVLLIDDSLQVRQRLRNLIQESSQVQVVAEAGTVATALTQFHIHVPDAVVLDLGLVDGDGGSVLAEIKRLRPACVVVMLSLIATPECRDFCLGFGADYFFDKSRDFDRVPAVLASLDTSNRGRANP